jgi:hypothetical protein
MLVPYLKELGLLILQCLPVHEALSLFTNDQFGGFSLRTTSKFTRKLPNVMELEEQFGIGVYCVLIANSAPQCLSICYNRRPATANPIATVYNCDTVEQFHLCFLQGWLLPVQWLNPSRRLSSHYSNHLPSVRLSVLQN